MPTKKMRVELFDGEGNKYTVAFEGQITREKALRLLDLVELLGGGVGTNVSSGTNMAAVNNELSKYEKVYVVIQKSFPLVWFTSKDIQAAYELEFKEPINLSTVATYFSRMANKGLLMKEGAANRLKYRAVQNISQTVIKQKIS
jgi:hypothetical protein